MCRRIGPRPRSPDRIFGLTAALLLAAAGAAHSQTRGQADIALQGYFQGANSQSLPGIAGVAVRFRDLLPHVGLIDANFESYRADGVVLGENYLELRGAPWKGRRWNLAGGDFRVMSNTLPTPFYNVFSPEITARGFKIQATGGGREYTLFFGLETVVAGPRVPYRLRVPQMVLGATAVRKVKRHLQLGARFYQFSPTGSANAEQSYQYSLASATVRTFTLESLFAPGHDWRIYSQASASLVGPSFEMPAHDALTQLGGTPTAALFEMPAHHSFSALTGVSYDTKPFSLRVNYVRQTAEALPVAGFFLGDRLGPYGDLRWHPLKRLEISFSASQYANNIARDPLVAALRSRNLSAGISLDLPFRFNALAQITTVRIEQEESDSPLRLTRQQQWSTGIGRTFGHHSLRLSYRQLRLDSPQFMQRQTSYEAEDVFQWNRLVAGGAVRLQRNLTASDRRHTVYGRGLLQARLGWFNAYANVEIGNDLANRTLFAVNTYTTTVFGASAHFHNGWDLRAEMFRNRLNLEINPESAFALGANGVGVVDSLYGFNQWNFYFRVAKQLEWGGGLPIETLDQFTTHAVPLTGSVEGMVRLKAAAGDQPAQGIPVTLDQDRKANSDAQGMYRFDEVPEGEHMVALSATELPADYNPGAIKEVRVVVQPRRVVRGDLDVVPLVNIAGRIAAPAEADVSNVLLRLEPSARYTTARATGRFAFYNLPEGDYELVLDPSTLPEGAVLQSPARIPVGVRVGKPVPPLEFRIAIPKVDKKIRKVLDR